MGNKLTADEIVTQGHKRIFIQYGGPSPLNVPKYAGQDAQYMTITGVGAPESGETDPIWVPDPSTPKGYRLVGRSVSAPDLPSATLTMYEKHGALPKQLGVIGCSFNLYEPTGNCKDLSDFLSGWTDYVLIYEFAKVTDKNLGDRTGFDSDDAVSDELTLTLSDIYPIGALGFGDNATTMVDLEVIDVVYGSKRQCGECGPEDDGTRRAYAVVKSSGSGSPGLPSEVVYTVDGGANWTQTNVSTMSATEDPQAIEVVGKYLVVLSRTASSATVGGYHIAEIDSDTGIPGTWTKVTAGFVANKQPNDICVASPREIYICADGGYIYKATDIAAGVTVLSAAAATTQNLARIACLDETIVAVGASGSVVKSTNRGLTFAATSAPSAANLQALAIVDNKKFLVGTATGYLYYTLNAGSTWTEKPFSGSGAGQVYDLVCATSSVLFMSHSTATPAGRIFSSWDGGQSWTNSSPRILNVPTNQRINRIAVPTGGAGAMAAANTVLAGGLSATTDGILLLGTPSKI